MALTVRSEKQAHLHEIQWNFERSSNLSGAMYSSLVKFIRKNLRHRLRPTLNNRNGHRLSITPPVYLVVASTVGRQPDLTHERYH